MERQWGFEPDPPPLPVYDPATDPMYAPAQNLSYAEPYVPPADAGYGDVGYGADSPMYAPAQELSYQQPYVAPEATPQYSEPMQDPFQQMMYAPAQDLGYQSDPLQQMAYQPDAGLPFTPDQLDSWESPQNFSRNEWFSTVNGDDIGQRAQNGNGLDITPYFPQNLLDSWESPQNFTKNEWFSTVNGEDIGGYRPSLNPNFSEGGVVYNPAMPLDPSQVDDQRNAPPPPVRGGLMMGPLGLVDSNGVPIDPSLYQQFGFGATGSGDNGGNFFSSRNPNFVSSNAQFDATTNPANRDGVGILGGLQNAASGLGEIYKTDIPVYSDFAREQLIPGVAGALNAQNPLTYFDNPVGNFFRSGNEEAAKGIVPVSLGDAALAAAPLLGKLGEGAQVAERGYGGILAGTNLDSGIFSRAQSLDELPIGAARAALDNPLQNPAYSEVANLAVGNLPRSLGGGAADDAARFLDEVAKDPQWSRVINEMRAQKITDADIVQNLAENGFTANTDVGKAARQFIEGAPTPEAPITDLKAALQKDLGITAKETAQPSLLDDVAPEVRRDLGIASKADDPVEQATRDVLSVVDNGPAPVAGSQPDLFGYGQMAAPEAAGPAKYEWQAVPELDVPLSTRKLVKAAIDNPSTSTLVPLVEDAAKSKLGQQALNLGLDATDSRSLSQKIVDELISLTGLPRELKASFDQSIPGRQGLALAFRHPQEWAQSWGTWAKSWGSEDGFRVVNQDAENLVTKWKQFVGEDGVIHLNTIDRGAPGTERIAGFEAGGEGFLRNVSKALGTEKFERSAVAFINSQRSKTMDTMFNSLWQSGERNPNVYRNLAAIIDHATGYGAAPLKGDIASRLLFSQRFMTSRFQFLADPVVQGLARGDRVAAQAAMENLIAFAGGSAAILGILDMGAEKAGVDALKVEWDPRSTDFGKIRVGPTRIDFGAGFLPLIRTATQIGTGEKKQITGEITPIQKFNQDTFKKESRVSSSGKLALNFFRNKLDPVTGEVYTRIAGSDAVGQPPTQIASFSTLENMFAPLIAQSVHDNLRNGGNPLTAGVAAAGEFFGGASSTYGPGQAAQQDIAKSQYGVDYGQIPSPYQAQINAEIPNIQISERLAPWWNSRNDAVKWYQSQITGDETDPRIQAAKEATNYQDLGIRLQQVMENEYGLSRTEAEKEVSKTLDSMVGDIIDQYRKDVMAADPGFAKSWLDAYNARQTPYKPPVWVQKLANGE